MSAPKTMMANGKLLPFFHINAAGKKEYRQVDDEILEAFEADVQDPNFNGLQSIGMLCARIRSAEAGRDEAIKLAATSSAQLAEANAAIATWGKLVEEVKGLADSLKRQFSDATKAAPLTRVATLIEVADRCRRDAERATTDTTGVERATLLSVAVGAQNLASAEFTTLTRAEIEAALEKGKVDAAAVRKAMDRGGWIP